jgi:hypothetical protein
MRYRIDLQNTNTLERVYYKMQSPGIKASHKMSQTLS